MMKRGLIVISMILVAALFSIGAFGAENENERLARRAQERYYAGGAELCPGNPFCKPEEPKKPEAKRNGRK